MHSETEKKSKNKNLPKSFKSGKLRDSWQIYYTHIHTLFSFYLTFPVTVGKGGQSPYRNSISSVHNRLPF